MELIKICCLCSKKTKYLFSGFCENCFSKKNPPVKKIKDINFKVCNFCKKFHYKGSLYTQEEVEKFLPRWILNYILIDKNFTIKKLEIKDFGIVKNKLVFNLEMDFELKTN